jgi:hypothetical protein
VVSTAWGTDPGELVGGEAAIPSYHWMASRRVISTEAPFVRGAVVKLFFANLLNRIASRFWGHVPSDAADRDSDNFFNLGAQYYLAARAATFAGCFPVAGALFHHAVEFCMKGDLRLGLSRRRLKEFGHNLKRLWAVYKTKHRATDLSTYDSQISQLHKFERIRYPDRITDRGMFGTIQVWRTVPAPSMWSANGRMLPSYHLVVNDIDQLVRAIINTSSLNPEALFGRYGEEGRGILHRDNTGFPTT